jgi:hypothetical protein
MKTWDNRKRSDRRAVGLAVLGLGLIVGDYLLQPDAMPGANSPSQAATDAGNSFSAFASQQQAGIEVGFLTKLLGVARDLLPELAGAIIVAVLVHVWFRGRYRADYLQAMRTHRLALEQQRLAGRSVNSPAVATRIQQQVTNLVRITSQEHFGTDQPDIDRESKKLSYPAADCSTCGNPCELAAGACVTCGDEYLSWRFSHRDVRIDAKSAGG